MNKGIFWVGYVFCVIGGIMLTMNYYGAALIGALLALGVWMDGIAENLKKP